MMRVLALLLTLLAGPLHAAIETFEFANEEQRLRYLEFARELRCPKCQNQNLADSNAPIAADLRHELYRLLNEGKTDREIWRCLKRALARRFHNQIKHDLHLLT